MFLYHIIHKGFNIYIFYWLQDFCLGFRLRFLEIWKGFKLGIKYNWILIFNFNFSQAIIGGFVNKNPRTSRV